MYVCVRCIVVYRLYFAKFSLSQSQSIQGRDNVFRSFFFSVRHRYTIIWMPLMFSYTFSRCIYLSVYTSMDMYWVFLFISSLSCALFVFFWSTHKKCVFLPKRKIYSLNEFILPESWRQIKKKKNKNEMKIYTEIKSERMKMHQEKKMKGNWKRKVFLFYSLLLECFSFLFCCVGIFFFIENKNFFKMYFPFQFHLHGNNNALASIDNEETKMQWENKISVELIFS